MTPAHRHVCKSPEARHLKTGKWVKVTAVVDYEYVESYHKEGPVLTALSVEPVEPSETGTGIF